MHMASNVYFTDIRSRSEKDNNQSKIHKLLLQKEFSSIFSKNDLTAIKIHFGEKGNDAYINPTYVRVATDYLKRLGSKPFLTDTNTLYKGSRSNAVDHLVTAIENGFAYAVVGAPLIIADGLISRDFESVDINKKHLKTVKIAQTILNAQSMLVMSHFKGHEMSGFGGAIKNLAMGCAPVAGKMEQHSSRPYIKTDLCIGCKSCAQVCPVEAITLSNKKATLDTKKCAGCGDCLFTCSTGAISLNWDTELPQFIERMTESALGAVHNKEGKVLYINFLLKISPECDCYGYADSPLVPDIGILASQDPIALDRACFDLVNAQTGLINSQLSCNHEPGQDKFKGTHTYVDGTLALSYGETIGLGTNNYNLIKT